MALEDGIEYAWVDTCCIDKTSSAELSEAINSMFQWYEKAQVCYAYLADVSAGLDPTDDLTRAGLTHSRWFTRGWTLQELIAPSDLVFFASNWENIETRGNLAAQISKSTGIDTNLLLDGRAPAGSQLGRTSIARRMSWAATRETTRSEDLAYCLLGIFGINMPLLYGEGARAFIRLQEEIIRHTDDHSIFAWSSVSQEFKFALRGEPVSALAPSPSFFNESGDTVQADVHEETSSPFALTNRGIRIDLRIFREYNMDWGILHCRSSRGHIDSLLAIPLSSDSGGRWSRVSGIGCLEIYSSTWQKAQPLSIYLTTKPTSFGNSFHNRSFVVRALPKSVSLEILSQEHTWSPSSGVITKSDQAQALDGANTKSEQTLDVLQFSLKPSGESGSQDGPHPRFSPLTVTVTVRQLQLPYTGRFFVEANWQDWNWMTRTPPEHLNYVSYDIKRSDTGRTLGIADLFSDAPFVHVGNMDVLGKKTIVIDIFRSTFEWNLLKLLYWPWMRVHSIVSKPICAIMAPVSLTAVKLQAFATMFILPITIVLYPSIWYLLVSAAPQLLDWQFLDLQLLDWVKRLIDTQALLSFFLNPTIIYLGLGPFILPYLYVNWSWSMHCTLLLVIATSYVLLGVGCTLLTWLLTILML